MSTFPCAHCSNGLEGLSFNLSEELLYFYCPYRDKHKFKNRSLLLKFLKKYCPVWEEDSSHEYSIDYIIANFLKIADDHSLLRNGVLYCNPALQKIFKTNNAIIYPRALRGLIETHMVIEYRTMCHICRKFQQVFPDNPHMEALISSLSIQASLFINHWHYSALENLKPPCLCKALRGHGIAK